MDERLDTELAELAQDVRHLAVADVVDVLLEREAENANARASHRDVRVDEQLPSTAGHVAAHVVVDTTAREDHLGLVTELLRLRG